ncbi:iron-containing alcohol dehydrogenase [Lacrimispora saccharolytica]|uniref:Iron-containing alcohol dehydrogenase n=1 Tax=Lacrimispora saccharolytica (strain ATCC 35040 / DSM 2544 / NRCC 2533 / WM1) TaxID=610130 RepID=D9R603_LACSW|nr:iron-containing alcohol dehydrogenase [Lacrimispora saccharolytica]ADL03437.1 iron-containing alcohol dehydrogenase [[Clostridium] saccharolyticum WM1]QRV18412.1 iron-containing alcohol dehydrogenase [Lacrimispora saccharolytica]
MARFTLPRDLYHGKGALEELKNIKGKKAIVVVGGGSMKRFGFLDRVEACLKEAGMEVKLFEGVEPDPSVDTVMKGAEIMREFEPDWIVAIGGGSPIDAAKAMWAFYEYPETSFEDLCIPFNFPTLRTKARFCAIPSTSGTATEVTAFSVITDYKKGIKYPLADFNITPDIAIVDPDLAETMPQKLTAHTGMDAMTHAVEAYVSTLHCDYTDPLALHAIKMIHNDLIDSFNGDKEARARMHNAQCLAGMAFSNALLGIVHSMAHKTGAAYSGGHIVHGCANAMYLPKVIKFNSKAPEAAKRYAEIARFIGLQGGDENELVDALITEIRYMNKKLDIPTCIKEYEGGIIDEAEFNEKLVSVAELAVGDACTGSNPRPITPAEMEKLLTCCYYDKEVDF